MTWALGRWEGRRLLGSPILWVAALATLAIIYLEGRYEAVSLPHRSVIIAGACLTVAAVALLMGHAISRRSQRPDMEELLTPLPMTGPQRKAGEVVAALAPATLAVLATGAGVVWSLTRNPAGSISWLEILVGPVVVILAHVLGVSQGKLRNPLVGPLVLVALVGLFLIRDLWPGARVIPAVSPFLPWRAPYTEWVQGEPRLPLVHLAYLAALITVISSLMTRAWKLLVVGSIGLAGLAVVLSSVPTHGLLVYSAVAAWSQEQPVVCDERDGVRYCAYEGYEPWIDYWAEVVGEVRAVIPTELAVEEVRQTVQIVRFEDDPALAMVPGTWYLGPEESRSSRLAVELLAPALGLPGTYGEVVLLQGHLPECMRGLPLSAFGEARGVALIVLLGIAMPPAVPDDAFGAFGGSANVGTVEVAPGELDLAKQILVRPATETLGLLHSHWNEILEPATTSDTLASWFGLPAPSVPTKSPDELMFETMDCSCNPEGGFSCGSRNDP